MFTGRLLRFGSVGDDMRSVQAGLNQAGRSKRAPLVCDGIFGPLTHGRVVEFQGTRNLVCDGIVGKNTYGALEPFIALADRLLKRAPQRPPLAPVHIRYFLNKTPPEMHFDQLVWAPLKVTGPFLNHVATSNKMVVAENCVALGAPTTIGQDVNIFGRTPGDSTLHLSYQISPAMPDPNPPLVIKVKVFSHNQYRLSFGTARTMVIQAPDPDLPTYIADHVVKTHAAMDAGALFNELAKRLTDQSVEHLVFNAHGGASVISAFGLFSPNDLTIANIGEWNKIKGKATNIWLMTCMACANDAFVRGIANRANSHVIGTLLTNTFSKKALGHNEISYFPANIPKVMAPSGQFLFPPDYYRSQSIPVPPNKQTMIFHPV